MTNRISVYQEHGNALCLNDGAFTITFFPQQVSFVENEDGYTIKIRPSLVEANITIGNSGVIHARSYSI